MKMQVYRWAGVMLAVAALSSCYYYPVAGGVAGAPTDTPYNPYADEKSGSVPVYESDYVPPQASVAPPPVVARPAFTMGISLPPIIFGHHHHHHHHGCHRR